MQDPILIVGAPRSGTSLTAGIIHACGAWGGEMTPADEYNEKGYFENFFLMRELGQLSASYFSASINHTREELDAALRLCRIDLEKELKTQRSKNDDGAWFFKTPDILMMPDFYCNLFPNSPVVVVRRNMSDIFASNSRCGLFAEREDGSVQSLIDRIEPLKVGLAEDRVFEIWPFKSLGGQLSEYQALVEWCGLEWDEAAVRAFIDPSLCHYDREGALKNLPQPE